MENGARPHQGVKQSQSRGSGFKRINLNKAHLGLERERQINPKLPPQSFRRYTRAGAPNEGSFTEFEKSRGPRLGLTNAEIQKIGQTYCCIRQSRLNTDAEKRNAQREQFRRFECKQHEDQIIDLMKNKRKKPLVLLPPRESEEELKKPSTPRIRQLSRSQLPKKKVFNVPLLEPQSGEQKPELEVDLFEMMKNLPKKEPLFPIFETDCRIVRGSNKGSQQIARTVSNRGSPIEWETSPLTADFSSATHRICIFQQTSNVHGHWHLPLQHHSSVETVFKANYIDEEDLKGMQREHCVERTDKDRRRIVFRSEYTTQYQDLGKVSRKLNKPRQR
ncbi:Oidioi.mRNA.OKI2018_I69.XSR.g14386.t1.cds [Oikopleura dioica]|uniref:Oidioi.mRNA.OKI2018_I69.XSR.g14386.t1.cds n=1 Tax=Oikopleura dioica TaxID=34765 RepID=A0ABN7SBE9_OIKDI|nr:Oidioi.mRNA.OKI2018_I69.XSR.g14386.t1.cds [Oikopleura dioica]